MRARELAFKGDAEMLTQSRLAVREEFFKHKVCVLSRASRARLAASPARTALAPGALCAACDSQLLSARHQPPPGCSGAVSPPLA